MMRFLRVAALVACALSLALPASAQVIGSGHVMGNGTSSPRTPTDTPLNNILQQSGSGVTLSGNTSTLATVSGTVANGHCRSTDSNGNEVDAGGPCMTGGSGGTVISGAVYVVPNASGSQQTTTGSIGSGSYALSLAAASDWVNGEGILVPGAGATFSASPPTGLGLTVSGGASTAYAYTVACIDAAGGEGIAPANVTTAAGPATLNNSANFIKIAWTAGAGCSRYALYGNHSGSMAYMGVTYNTFFYDYGAGAKTSPFWASTAVPVAAINDWLLTTVASGGGTTGLTLAASAGHTVSAVTLYHEDSVALQAAINALPVNGGDVDIGSLIYNLANGLTIGNGGVGLISTRTGIVLRGDNAAVNGLGWSGYGSSKGAALNWIGSSSAPVLEILGPLQGFGVQNLAILCSDLGAYGLQVQSGQFGDIKNLYIYKCKANLFSNTVPAFGGNNTDSLHNSYNNISIFGQDYDQTYEWIVTGDNSGGTSDTDYTDAHNILIAGSATAYNYGLDFVTSDSNMFDNLHFSGNWSGLGVSVLFDYVDSFGSGADYPSSNILSKVDLAGGSVLAVGAFSASASWTNQIWQLVGVNGGGACPTVSGLTCHAN